VPSGRSPRRPAQTTVFKKETEYGRLIKQPDETGGAETQSAYVIVSDADAVYARAKAASAEIVIEIKDEDYGRDTRQERFSSLR